MHWAAQTTQCKLHPTEYGEKRISMRYLVKLLSLQTKLYQFVFWQNEIPEPSIEMVHIVLHTMPGANNVPLFLHMLGLLLGWRERYARYTQSASSCIWHIVRVVNVQRYNGMTSMHTDHEISLLTMGFMLDRTENEQFIDCVLGAGCFRWPKARKNEYVQRSVCAARVCVCVSVWDASMGAAGRFPNLCEWQHTCSTRVERERNKFSTFMMWIGITELLCKRIIPSTRTP